MTTDYGYRPPTRRVPMKVILGVGLVVLVAIVVSSFLRQRQLNVAAAQGLRVSGPPCPTVTADQAKAEGLNPAQAFVFDDITFARAYGHVSCEDSHGPDGTALGSYAECQFTSPHVIAVTVKDQTSWFFPGPGKPATVTVPHGKPACVLASNFKG